jgi:hypothetical protein
MTRHHAAPDPADDLQHAIDMCRSRIANFCTLLIHENMFMTCLCIYEQLPGPLCLKADADVDAIV